VWRDGERGGSSIGSPPKSTVLLSIMIFKAKTMMDEVHEGNGSKINEDG
jgi:hypothetical protein